MWSILVGKGLSKTSRRPWATCTAAMGALSTGPMHTGRATVALVSCCVSEWDPTWSRLLGSSVASGPRECSGTWLPRPFAINCPLFLLPAMGGDHYLLLSGGHCLPAHLLPPAISSLWSSWTLLFPLHLPSLPGVLLSFSDGIQVSGTRFDKYSIFMLFTNFSHHHAPALVSDICVKTGPWHTRSANDIKSQWPYTQTCTHILLYFLFNLF